MLILQVKAIALNELQNPKHESLLRESSALARKVVHEFEEMPVEKLAVEIAVCEWLYELSMTVLTLAR